MPVVIQIFENSLQTINLRLTFAFAQAHLHRSISPRREKQLVVFRRSPTSRPSRLQYLPQWLLPRRARSRSRPRGATPISRANQVVVHTAAFRHRLQNITPVASLLPFPNSLRTCYSIGLPLAADLPRRHRRAADAAEDYDDSL